MKEKFSIEEDHGRTALLGFCAVGAILHLSQTVPETHFAIIAPTLESLKHAWKITIKRPLNVDDVQRVKIVRIDGAA